MKRILKIKNPLGFKNYVKLTPQEAVEHFQLGQELVEQKNFMKAYEFLLKSAETRTIGTFYALGLTGEKSFQKAESWFKKAVSYGDEIALTNLSSLYEQEGDIEKSKKTVLKAIEKYNSPEANIQLGVLHYRTENFLAAIKIFQKYQEHSIAKHYAAEMFLFGKGVPVNYEKAKELYEDVQDEIPMAQTMLGYIHLKGFGCEVNYDMAKERFEQSMEESPLSMTFLGTMYVEGLGVEKNVDKGLRLIEHAASLEEGNAIAYLANYQSKVKANTPIVERFLNRLVEKKDPFATQALKTFQNKEKIEERMRNYIETQIPLVDQIKFPFTEEQEDTLSEAEKAAIIREKRTNEIYRRIEEDKCDILFGEQQLENAEIFVKNLKSIAISREEAMQETKNYGFRIDESQLNELFKKHFDN